MMRGSTLAIAASLAILLAFPAVAEVIGTDDPNSHFLGASLPPGHIVLTYDDGPGANTLQIAQFLSELGIQATFFVSGCRFVDRPDPSPSGTYNCSLSPNQTVETLEYLVRMGHRVANHTQDHVHLPQVSAAEVLQQVGATQQVIDAVIVDGLYYLRPPYGQSSAAIAALLNADPYLSKLTGPFYWDINGRDYACIPDGTPGYRCAVHYLRRMPGPPATASGMVLLHDRLEDEETCRTYQLSTAMVPVLRDRGYVFLPIDAIPGTLGPRRLEASGHSWTPGYSDAAGWNNSASYYLSLQLGDIDADGDADLCGRGNAGIWCARSNGAGFGRTILWLNQFRNNEGYFEPAYGSTLRLGDIDGDGDADVCLRGNDGLRCALSRGPESSSFGPASRWSAGLDFSDADGWGSLPSYYESIQLADVDGDGRADACGRSRLGIRCALSTGSGFAPSTIWIRDFDNQSGWASRENGSTIRYGDLNGDGRADVCGRANRGMRCALSVPGASRFSGAVLWSRGPFSDDDGWNASSSRYLSIQLADVDTDGLADVCGRNNTGIVCMFSDASRFRTYQYLANEYFTDASGWGPEPYGATLRFADLNGDGRADACGRGVSGMRCARAEPGLLPLPPREPLPPPPPGPCP